LAVDVVPRRFVSHGMLDAFSSLGGDVAYEPGLAQLIERG
jgi:hypothetical protein